MNQQEGWNNLELAADQGPGEAQHPYARCLQMGCGVATFVREALNYCKLAADQGHDAQMQVALCSYHCFSWRQIRGVLPVN
jgi:TPR repeat protein